MPEAEVAEEMVAAARKPVLASEAARSEGLQVVPEVVYGLIAELRGYTDCRRHSVYVYGGARPV